MPVTTCRGSMPVESSAAAHAADCGQHERNRHDERHPRDRQAGSIEGKMVESHCLYQANGHRITGKEHVALFAGYQ